MRAVVLYEMQSLFVALAVKAISIFSIRNLMVLVAMRRRLMGARGKVLLLTEQPRKEGLALVGHIRFTDN